MNIENTTDLENIVNLEKYPFHLKGTQAYKTLTTRLRNQLDQLQICTLPDFLNEDVRQMVVGQAEALISSANPASSYRNVYLERSTCSDLPDDHPKNILAHASNDMIGAHILPDDSHLKKLYFSTAFQEFISDITTDNTVHNMGKQKLFPSADPYQPVNILCHKPGDKSAWHFDSGNAFTMTLLLQAPDSGGVFEIVPNIRSDENPNIDELRQVLLGDRQKVKAYHRDEGALVIFRGCHSAHRVTEITGTKTRMMCVMVYEREPGVIGDPVVNETVYGVKAEA